MVAIHNPDLEIERVEDHPGRRLARVSYDLSAARGDPMIGTKLVEVVRIHGRSSTGAPIKADTSPIVTHTEHFTVEEGTVTRTLVNYVHRVDLDVEQDWWSTGLGGETLPIAEWVDHLVADIELSATDEIICEATTPVVSGSWGALGHD